MSGKLRNTLLIPPVYFSIMRNINKQKKFIRTHFENILINFESSNDGSLSTKDFIKIRKYYGLAVPAILGEAFSNLRGYPLTFQERYVNTNMGVITGIFDDFFDNARLTNDYIKRMVEKPESIIPSTSNEKLFIDFYLSALERSSFPHLVKKYALIVTANQIDSVEQEGTGISYDRIWEITKDKGGSSVLFYRSGLDNELNVEEEETLFQLGSLMQLENDIFDTYKDSQDNILTIPTTIKNIQSLRNLYQEQVQLFIKLSYNMPYSRKKIMRFLDKIMPVINRGFVCLDQYQKLEDINNGVFDISVYSRKQLICDMEAPGNIVRTIYYQIISTY